jgi:hypothetical protein
VAAGSTWAWTSAPRRPGSAWCTRTGGRRGREGAGTAVTTALAGREWDVVVIGGGVRKADPLVPLLEQVVSLVRQYAPKAAIAFNTSGADSVEAAQRWL